MTEIYLIRHTQAEGNRYRMMQGSWDGDITELGRKQIDALAERFREIPLDAVYSSDLKRAVLTAEGAARGKNLPIQTRTTLREVNIGPWEQKFFANLCHEVPELTNTFLFDAENWKLEGAETFQQVRERAMAELTKIARENEGKMVAVASHGVTIRCIMSAITGIPLTDVKSLPIFRNTSVTKLRWEENTFHIEYMNDASHLPETAITNWETTRNIRDERFDPLTDQRYYEKCYADAWMAAHGNLKNYSPEIYLDAARRHHRANPDAVLKVFQEDEPVGLVDLDPEREANRGVGWISLLYLKPEYRNRGYGIQLLGRAIFFYKKLGRTCLRLQTAEENAIARAFYRREGFAEISEQKTANGKLFVLERQIGG